MTPAVKQKVIACAVAQAVTMHAAPAASRPGFRERAEQRRMMAARPTSALGQGEIEA